MNAFLVRWKGLSPDLRRFFWGTFLFGLGVACFDSVFNNFLHNRFDLSAFGRTFLELPRETPGLLTVVFAALLFFIGSRRRAAWALLLCSVGLALMGTLSLHYAVMLVWLFVFSVGQHLWLPLSSSIGMELATAGGDGRRLGQLNAVRNAAAVVGSGLIFVLFWLFPLPLEAGFWLASAVFLVGSLVLFRLTPDAPHRAHVYWNFPKEYRRFYALTVLYGSRKQIFLTFAPWVLVSVLGQPVTVIAILLTVGGVLGILFQPLLGKAIDAWGEKTVLALEAFLLIFVCAAYALGPLFLPHPVALGVAAVCYLLDQILMSVGMARATYLKKIARTPDEVTPTLTMAVSVDHVFSISVALGGGVLWFAFGFWTVFVFGACIAAANLATALGIKSPQLLKTG
jgi:MFS family permease